MKRWCWLLLVGVSLIPCAAWAQEAGDATPYRRWESSAGLQLAFWPNDDPVVRTPAWIIDVGRFWSEHVATTAALTVNADTRSEYVYTSSGAQSYRLEYTASRPAGLQLGLQYQFFENVFAHPYLLTGAQIGWFTTYRVPRSTPVPDYLGGSVQARPFVGGGFKSYFDNGRAFMRSEFSLFVDTHGTPRGVIRIGAGVEF